MTTRTPTSHAIPILRTTLGNTRSTPFARPHRSLRQGVLSQIYTSPTVSTSTTFNATSVPFVFPVAAGAAAAVTAPPAAEVPLIAVQRSSVNWCTWETPARPHSARPRVSHRRFTRVRLLRQVPLSMRPRSPCLPRHGGDYATLITYPTDAPLIALQHQRYAGVYLGHTRSMSIVHALADHFASVYIPWREADLHKPVCSRIDTVDDDEYRSSATSVPAAAHLHRTLADDPPPHMQTAPEQLSLRRHPRRRRCIVTVQDTSPHARDGEQCWGAPS
ncbi:hypothetical protein DFH06DRAFT_438927 [Mycena polygramma]|nr:hypothetical protein DFH06DRAFT_438927 [Mycena polygramma]